MDKFVIVALSLLLVIVYIAIIKQIIISEQKDNNTIIESSDNPLKIIVKTEDYDRLISINNYVTNPSKKYNLGFYNMSVIKNNNGFFGVIRGSTWNGCCTNNTLPSESSVYEIELNNDGDVTKLERIRVKDTNLCNNYNGIEDGRIFIYKDEKWVIGNALGLKEQNNPCVNVMCIFKLYDSLNTFRVLDSPNKIHRQKNWSMFEYNKELYAEYSINPHVVFKINPSNGTIISIFGNINDDINDEHSLRGGACPILIDNFYLGIGHCRRNGHYLHFFYIFENKPPFDILGITTFFKLDGDEKIQFVTGLSLYKDIIYVSYGVNDCFNRMSNFHLDDILNLF
jgi:predicted GH43/DUF377 family glycosyl hydrolase